MSYKVETVLKKTARSVAEGPYWEESSQSLLFVDIFLGNIHRYNTLTRLEEKRHYGGRVSLIVPRKSGGYVVSNDVNLSHLDWNTGDLTSLAAFDKNTYNKFNDGKCDDTGRLWAGTIGYQEDLKTVIPEGGSLYTLETDLSTNKRFSKVSLSNGMAWTHNNKYMYYADSIKKLIWVMDFDVKNGNVSNERIFRSFQKHDLPGLGIPDGMTSDLQDKLWCAFYGSSCVVCFDTATGQENSRVELPTSQITSCCWGGQNYNELYVTSGEEGINEELSGSIFRVTGLGGKGKAAAIFQG